MPCGDNVCEEHLKEPGIVQLKVKKITCKKCNQAFQSYHNREFKINKSLISLLESEAFLSDEELNLKTSLEEGHKKFFLLQEQLESTKNGLEVESHSHFQEIRRKIDLQREELKDQIDKISLEMIDRVKAYELNYVQELNKNIEKFVFTMSLETELKDLNEKFRDPKLQLQLIKQMKLDQDENINEIESKLEEIIQIKVNLNSQKFEPSNFVIDEYQFGSLFLNGCSMVTLESKICTANQARELIKLCEFKMNEKWSLLYRGSRDGFGSKDFHSKCAGHTNTLVIVKASGVENIFGGFVSIPWSYAQIPNADPNAFLFSLVNTDNCPCKMKIESDLACINNAVAMERVYGPVFGCYHGDLAIFNNGNLSKCNKANLGKNYKHPQYQLGTNEAKCFMGGSEKFQIDEIEVFSKE